MENSGKGDNKTVAGGATRSRRERWLAIALLALAVPYCAYSYMQWRNTNEEESRATDYRAFLKAMEKAETIADPLQRCLQYPDIPGSHWNAETTRTYCELRTHRTIQLAEIDALLKQGKAADVDRVFQSYLDAPLHDERQLGLLDIAFQNAGFETASDDARRVIDEWKKQSPDSAFALAASGVQYVDAAHNARGFGWAADLGEKQVIDMHQLLILARQDLDRSVALLPSVTSAYAAMIFAGALEGDDDYRERAAVLGLKADPYNFRIRSQMMNQAQPKWGSAFGGEYEQQKEDEALAAHNPLLRIVAQNPDIYRATCNCGYSVDRALQLVIRAAEKNVSTGNLITLADEVFDSDPRLAVELYAQSLRFDPTQAYALQWRSQDMLNLGDKRAAINVIAAASKRFPENTSIATQLAHMYWHAGRIQEAEKTYLAVLQQDPDQQEAMGQLGDMYNHEGHQPDKAEALADALIQRHPDNPAGYIVRACNQMDHDLPGRYETIHYFLDHFGAQPELKKPADEMRGYLARHPEPPRV